MIPVQDCLSLLLHQVVQLDQADSLLVDGVTHGRSTSAVAAVIAASAVVMCQERVRPRRQCGDAEARLAESVQRNIGRQCCGAILEGHRALRDDAARDRRRERDIVSVSRRRRR